ncbi:PAS domain-containing protein [Thalassobaculum sp.]|uniref:PAS domain-containing protein n=1 Tax=Thalassobaculum sp. TaxID=2022740 RepID=UPI003B59B8FF
MDLTTNSEHSAQRPLVGDFEHVRDARLRDLLAFWLTARGRNLIPRVDQIDPVLFPRALSGIWMCDVLEDDPRGRWLYRLVGEHTRTAYRQNIVGRTLEEITDATALDRVVRYFSIATDWPAIVHVCGRIYAEAAQPARGERLILPFLDPASGRTGRLLGATVHSWLEIGYSEGDIPAHQTRTYTRADGDGVFTETSA